MPMMKDSQIDEAWLQRMIAANPCVILPNELIRTCPVRLAFTALTVPFKPKKGDDPNKKPTYGAALLFPPGVEQQIQDVFYRRWYEMCKQAHPRNFDQNGEPFGLTWPFHPCAEKQQHAGYTPGLYYFDTSSQFKPAIVDAGLNPVVDESRIYPGVWALVSLNAYSYDNKKKGVGFGIQSVMLLADDTKLFKAGGDPSTEFAGAQVDQAFQPSQAFGQTPATGPQQPPGMPGMPGPSVLPPPQPVSNPPVAPAAPPTYAPPQPTYAPPAPAWPQQPVENADDYIQ